MDFEQLHIHISLIIITLLWFILSRLCSLILNTCENIYTWVELYRITRFGKSIFKYLYCQDDTQWSLFLYILFFLFCFVFIFVVLQSLLSHAHSRRHSNIHFKTRKTNKFEMWFRPRHADSVRRTLRTPSAFTVSSVSLSSLELSSFLKYIYSCYSHCLASICGSLLSSLDENKQRTSVMPSLPLNT